MIERDESGETFVHCGDSDPLPRRPASSGGERGALFPVFPAAHKSYTALSSISERDRTTTGTIAVTMMSRAAAAPSSTIPREAFS